MAALDADDGDGWDIVMDADQGFTSAELDEFAVGMGFDLSKYRPGGSGSDDSASGDTSSDDS